MQSQDLHAPGSPLASCILAGSYQDLLADLETLWTAALSGPWMPDNNHGVAYFNPAQRMTSLNENPPWRLGNLVWRPDHLALKHAFGGEELAPRPDDHQKQQAESGPSPGRAHEAHAHAKL